MEKTTEQFFVDPKSHQIWSRVVWSRRFIKELRADETKAIIETDFPRVFVNYERDQLTEICAEELPDFWVNQLRDHIANGGDDIDLDAYENGHCFTAQLWKAKGGDPIIVLRQYH